MVAVDGKKRKWKRDSSGCSAFLIINILFLVEKALLDTPILFLSHYILHTKSAYYEGLRQVTENGAWVEWVLYMLEAIKVTALETQRRVNKIREAMDEAKELIRTKAPKIYTKDLVEVIFQHPYCKISFLEEGSIAKRQTAALYLRTLEELGLLRSVKFGKEKYYINTKLVSILSQ